MRKILKCFNLEATRIYGLPKTVNVRWISLQTLTSVFKLYWFLYEINKGQAFLDHKPNLYFSDSCVGKTIVSRDQSPRDPG